MRRVLPRKTSYEALDAQGATSRAGKYPIAEPYITPVDNSIANTLHIRILITI